MEDRRLLRPPRLMLQCQDCDEGAKIHSIISVGDLILYLLSGVVYSLRANYLDTAQARRVVDTGIFCISPLSSNFVLFICKNGVVRIFSNYTGYTQDMFKIDLKESRKGETDPIHDILISACPHVQLLCIANIDVLYLLEVDLNIHEDNIHLNVDCEVDEAPKLISSTKILIELDADIESGCIWGDMSLQFLVYRSCTSLLIYEIQRNDRSESKSGVTINSAIEYQTDHSSYISATSHGANGIGVTGDIQGCLIIWKFSSIAEECESNEIVESRIITPWITDDKLFSSEVSYINVVSKKSSFSLIVSSVDGHILFLDIDESNNILTRRFLICGGTFGMFHPTHIKYEEYAKEHRLRVSSRVAGNTIDFTLDTLVNTQFNSNNAALYDKNHRNLVLCAGTLMELGLVFIATWDRVIQIFDFHRGKLIASVPNKNCGEICKLATFCSSISAKVCKFQLGTHSGHSREFSVLFDDTFILSETVNELDELTIYDKDDKGRGAELIKYRKQAHMNGADVYCYNFSEDEVLKVNISTRSVVTVKLIGDQMYSTLPVTDIFYSTKGLHTVICFARQKLVVHKSETNEVVSQIELHSSITNISIFDERLPVVSKYEDGGKAAIPDVLIIVLQGLLTIKVLDMLKKVCIFTSDSPNNIRAISCRLWRSSHANQMQGLICCEDRTFYSVHVSEEKDVQFQKILHPSLCPHDSNHVFRNMHVYRDQDLVLLARWNSRNLSCNLLEMSIENLAVGLAENTNAAAGTFGFYVDDVRCRIVGSFALNVPSRTNRISRMLIVLSDGTVCLIHK